VRGFGLTQLQHSRVADTLISRLLRRPASLAVLFACLTLILAAIPRLLSAANRFQEASAPTAQQPLQVKTEIVTLAATVTDERGEFVSDLQRKNFRILDKGVEQPIVFFAPAESPAQILVMVETSPAVYLIQNDHIAAMYALARGLSPDDEVSLLTYNDAPRVILPFTQDKASLTAALEQVQFTLGFGDLNLFDSISAVLDSMAAAPGKQAILLLSTGLDSSPASERELLMQKLHSSDVVIFPMALGSSLRGPMKKKKGKKSASGQADVFAEADRTLHLLADITGGRAFFPQSAADFAAMYREIAAALRHQYVLGIAPAHDGQFHPLTVQVLDDNGLPYPASGKDRFRRIYARQGYLAPSH
jgi:Ca-activated chloride channel homolog